MDLDYVVGRSEVAPGVVVADAEKDAEKDAKQTVGKSSQPLAVAPSIEELSQVDLAGWFEVNGRDLPWRRTRDPWAVLVSEVMLQQTQVGRVAERWEEFRRLFPDPAACAAAPRSDIIELWVGMGYNRRAVNLHRAARAMMAEHGGRVPNSLEDLLDLPGIGPYTARAVLAFAFEHPVAVLDTNVGRILARVSGARLTAGRAQASAERALADNDPWVWNQALLDVGATLCRSRSTDCVRCPLADVCRWHHGGKPEPDPATASAAVSSRQSRFEGSDRQGRGRLINALRNGPVAVRDVDVVVGWAGEHERVGRMLDALSADGLVRSDGKVVRLAED